MMTMGIHRIVLDLGEEFLRRPVRCLHSHRRNNCGMYGRSHSHVGVQDQKGYSRRRLSVGISSYGLGALASPKERDRDGISGLVYINLSKM